MVSAFLKCLSIAGGDSEMSSERHLRAGLVRLAEKKQIRSEKVVTKAGNKVYKYPRP